MTELHREDVLVPVQEGFWLKGILTIPANPQGIVVFAHGSGSGRLSPRNNEVAWHLQGRGFATLLMDLLHEDEERVRSNIFDISLLERRLLETNDWLSTRADLARLGLGYFGASTGAAAAIRAAAHCGDLIRAVVSRGGRPDLAQAFFPKLISPTLLIVGGADEGVLELNQEAFDQLSCPKDLRIVPGATHLFEEPGALDEVAELAGQWFEWYLPLRPGGARVRTQVGLTI